MLSSYKSDLLNDDSDDDGSDSRYARTCAFPFRFKESTGRVYDSVGRADASVGCVDDYVGCVCGMGSVVFILEGIKSIGDVVPLFVLYQ